MLKKIIYVLPLLVCALLFAEMLNPEAWDLRGNWSATGDKIVSVHGDQFITLLKNKQTLDDFEFQVRIKPVRAIINDNWKVAGIGLRKSENVFWNLNLVEQPAQVGTDRFMEMKLIEDGQETQSRLQCLAWSSFKWEYGKSYVFKLRIKDGKIFGWIEDDEGHLGEFGFNLEGCNVTSGSIFLRNMFLETEFTGTDLAASGSTELVDVTTAVSMVHPIKLVTPECQDYPVFTITNQADFDRQVKVNFQMEDYFGEILAEEKVVELAANSSSCVNLPWRPVRKGAYYLTCTITDLASQATCSQHTSFAVMTPTPKRWGTGDNFRFGVYSHFYEYQKPLSDLGKEALAESAIGANYVRSGIFWMWCQPNPGEFTVEHWLEKERIFADYGIELMPLIGFCPRWAVQKGYTPRYNLPGLDPEALHYVLPDYEAFEDFLAQLSAALKGHAVYFEPGNEPDVNFFCNYTTDEYLELQRAAYRGIKRGNPDAQVLNAGFAGLHIEPTKADIVERTAKECADSYDAFAIHLHGTFENYRSGILEMKPWITGADGTVRAWYPHETGIPSVGGIKSERRQAQNLFKKLLFSWANGAIGYTWYDLYNDGKDPFASEHNFGLLTYDFEPKFVYSAYNTLTTCLQDASFKQAISEDDRVFCYLFEANGKLYIPAWTERSTANFVFNTEASEAALIDIMGNASAVPVQEGKVSFSVTTDPKILCLDSTFGFSQENEVIKPVGELYGLANAESKAALNIVNPGNTARNLEVVFAGKTQQYQLGAGESRVVELVLPPMAEDAEKISVRYCWEGDKPCTVDFPVQLGTLVAVASHDAADFTLDQQEQCCILNAYDPSKEHMHWHGPQDLSGKFTVYLENDKLVLIGVVTDDVFVQNQHGANIWQADGLQYMLKFQGQSSYFEFGVAQCGETTECFIWGKPVEAPLTEADLHASVSKNRQETTYRLAIPLAKLGITQADLVRGFRYNVLINDDDGNGRKDGLFAAPGIGNDKDTTRFPVVIMR